MDRWTDGKVGECVDDHADRIALNQATEEKLKKAKMPIL